MTVLVEETPASILVSFKSKYLDEAHVREIGTQLLDAGRRAVAAGKGLIVDFKGVDLMCSAMIGKLVILNKFAKTNDVRMQMSNISPSIRGMFGPGFSGKPIPRPRKPSSDNGHADPPVS